MASTSSSSSSSSSSNSTTAVPTATVPPLNTTYHAFKVDYDKLHDFEFTPPPECPVYRPTSEEFSMGPLEYINKIRSEAQKYGICKIIPPKEFLVPFTIDINEFRFTPRIQRLNELEAMTRIKLTFHDVLFKFWDLQGVTLRYPTLEKRPVDLYTLRSVVIEEGGYDSCLNHRKWGKVAMRMNYNKSSATVLKQYYEKALFPYDLFITGATVHPEVNVAYETPEQANNDTDSKEKEGNNEANDDETKSTETLAENVDPQNAELKKLQVFGAGPKMPGFISDEKIPKGKKCYHCSYPNLHSLPILTCKKCEKSYHKQCLFPPFNENPKGKWHCHSCIAKILPTLPQLYTKDFGFIQSSKTYTLREFGEMANKFKNDYFGLPSHKIPLEDVEKEFWRIVSTTDNIVNVEYGADLHTNDYGSGFPTPTTKNLQDHDKPYIDSPWNLNNLPTVDGSVFKHINTNINGMIIPWMYVGMCFSAFCWHNEDHWTYSINYLHWGEPKIWYGVPGDKAEEFENAMRNLAPELFKSSPDLLHQLVTTCNPNLLTKEHAVPIYKATQAAGEYIVTFPRSYHSGFNQGFNFAEAVNFATSDWLTMGRLSVSDYASHHRYPVFSHDELICKMADSPTELEIKLAKATRDDIEQMITQEKEQRQNLVLKGVTESKRNFLENLKDDERLCDYCKTTCFLSALKCACDKSKLVCLNHYDHLCTKCSVYDVTLVYRYTADEFKIMLTNLRNHIDDYQEWAEKTEVAVKANRFKETTTLNDLGRLYKFAKDRHYNQYEKPYSELKIRLAEATKCSKYSRELIHLFDSQETNVNGQLSFEEFKYFVDKVNRLPCVIPERDALNALCKKIDPIAVSIIEHLASSSNASNAVTTSANTAISTLSSNTKASDLKDTIDRAIAVRFINFGVQLEKLKSLHQEYEWLEKYNQWMSSADNNSQRMSLSQLKSFTDVGRKMPSCSNRVMDTIKFLDRILAEATRWVEVVNKALHLDNDGVQLSGFEKPSFEYLETLLSWCDNNSKLKGVDLSPSYTALTGLLTPARQFAESANKIYGFTQKICSSDKLPLLDSVKELIARGRKIECKLERLPYLESLVASVESWIQQMTTAFVDRRFASLRQVDALLPPITEFDANWTPRKFYLVLSRKNNCFRENVFEQQLLVDFSSSNIKNVYKDYVLKESLFYETVREKNSGRRKIIELLEHSDPNHLKVTEKFCYCGKDFADYLIECQLCKDWFHQACVTGSNRAMERNSPIDTQQLYICCLCARGPLRTLPQLDNLMNDLKKMPVRFIEGELFKCYHTRVKEWGSRLQNELKAYKELKLLYTQQSDDFQMITDETQTILEDVLCQAFILGLDNIEEIKSLWRILSAVNPNRRTAIYNQPISPDLDKNILTWEVAQKRKNKSAGGSRSKKNKNRKAEEEDEDDEEETEGENYHYVYEVCKLGPRCTKPNGKCLNWIICDKCQKWFHMLCLEVVDPSFDQDVFVEDPSLPFFCFFCLNKSSDKPACKKKEKKS